MKNGKRCIAILLAMMMLMSAVPTALAAQVFSPVKTYTAGQFSDVETGQWYESSVQTAYELGLMSGDAEGTFRPSGQVTLAETVTVAARIHALATAGEEHFGQESPWYQVYVDYALEKGILSAALSDYTKAATRLEFAQILAKALPAENLFAINHVEEGAIPDVTDEESVYLLYRAGVLTGSDSKGTFLPESNIQRCEVAAIVSRMAVPELRQLVTLDKPEAVLVADTSKDTEKENDRVIIGDDREDKEENVQAAVPSKPAYVDENNALTKPFDEVYPDLFASGEVEYSGEHILIKLEKAPSGRLSKKLKDAGVTYLEEMYKLTKAVWYKAQVDRDVQEAMEAVRQIPDVLVAEYDYAYSASGIADAEEISSEVLGNGQVQNQWYLKSCGVQSAWKIYNHGANTVVAVIDTGVDYSHEDLKDNMWVNEDEIPENGIDDDENGYVDDYLGFNAIANNGNKNAFIGDPMDDNGHGTHVAGIIAGRNNNMGIVGIAYEAKVMAIKAGMSSGYFLHSDIAEAVLYAAANGADVINMSFGGNASSIAVQDALKEAYTYSVLVASAGNDGEPNEETDFYRKDKAEPNYPAALSYVLGVMSVGSGGVESTFTNWDAGAYNSVEYEVYAPGEQILSTIPDNKYASWNGTSMAAPVVSAMAAILKHEYPDQPTKFICGQLVNTSERSAICVNPEKHTVNGNPHNLPKIVDLYAALTGMPSPEVSVYDWYISDAADLNEENSEDGVIDAGETIALAFALRNRWGKSTDTQVTIDVRAHDAYEDPYVTILEPTMDYGEIGTYSTSDGKAQLEEAPFLLQIDKDCPNDYIIVLNVTVTCKNALDEADEKLYSGGSSITLKVRKGEVLEGTIKADTTLDPEKYYIIPSGLKVAAGATLTVLPGTQIQFWAADPEDYYADNGIAILNVEGTLLCEGTEENPIEIFPSDLMAQYQVDIHTSGRGVVRMEHTRVVNPYISISYAKNCEFTQNYQGVRLNYRSLSGSVVKDYGHSGSISIDRAEGCAFDRYGGGFAIDYYGHTSSGGCYGNYYDCIFVDCSVNMNGKYESCVFYGNLAYAKGSYIANMTRTAEKSNTIVAVEKVVTDPETGTTYVQLKSDTVVYDSKNLGRFAKILGGTLACINDMNEWQFIADQGLKGLIGLSYDHANEIYIWEDGTDADMGLLECEPAPIPFRYNKLEAFGAVGSYSYGVIVELPSEYVTGITLDRYDVIMDMEAQWQIDASSQPFDLFTDELIYESMDEAVAVVDDDGLVKPVGLGDTVIRVYAPDYYLWRELTVHVVESKPLESIGLGENFRMDVGTEKVLVPALTPADTSQPYLFYESSDEEVATISKGGVITAHREGETVITVTSAANSEITARVTVQVVIPAEEVTAEESILLLSKEGETWAEELRVTVLPEDATDTTLIWESSNPEIAYVDSETGELVKLDYGIATLRATVTGTEVYTEIMVCISEMNPDVHVVQMDGYDGVFMALLSDGTLWYWGGDTSVPTQMEGFAEVKQFAYQWDARTSTNAKILMVLNYDGELNYYRAGTIAKLDADAPVNSVFLNKEPMTDVKQIACSFVCSFGTGKDSFYFVKEDRSVWRWSENYYYTSPLTQIDLNGKLAEKVVVTGGVHTCDTYILDTEGTLWSIDPVAEYATGVVDVYRDTCVNSTPPIVETNGMVNGLSKKGILNIANGNLHFYIDKTGQVYSYPRSVGSNQYGQSGTGSTEHYNDYRKVLKVENAEKVFLLYGNSFFQTVDGKFYSAGLNDKNQLGNLTKGNSSIPVRVHFGLEIVEETPLLTEANCIDGIWKLDFDQALAAGSKYANVAVSDAAGNLQSIRKTIYLDKLLIEPYSGWTEGETYTLTIPANALQNKFSVAVEAQTVTFTAGETTEPAEETDAQLLSDVESEDASQITYYDETIERHEWTAEEVMEAWNTFKEKGFNTEFWNNAVLNRLNDSEVAKWLRITAPSGSGIIGMGGNYWGTTDKTMIERQLLDVTDNVNLYDLNPGEYLTEIPEELWPTITEAGLLNQDDQPVDVVGPETLTFYVEFNRDMDQSIPLDVRFGSHEPYADYQVDGEWKSARRWEGTMTLNTFVEAGIQYWCVDNGKAADSWQKLYKDWGRFQFTIDTTDALAMNLFANPTENGVELSWNQDDFDTLAGYNVYRSTQENGLYERLNDTIIPVGEEYFLDDTVYPSTLYYYIFTVVQTGGQMGDTEPESMPSGKVSVMTMDTLAPDMIHSPVRSGYEGSSITVTALVSDEREVQGVKLYYRIAGTDAWNVSEMSLLNNKYTSIIQYNYVTTAGVEYYIEAWDGSNYTYKGSSDAPYVITVYEALDQNAMGDVNGDGQITILDALMMLQAINGYIPSLTDEQFKRADLNGNENLEAAEVFTILRYVNGEIGSVTMQ